MGEEDLDAILLKLADFRSQTVYTLMFVFMIEVCSSTGLELEAIQS